MIMEKLLTGRQLGLARQVREAIHANPFTGKRHLANCALAGLAPSTAPDMAQERAIAKVENLMRRMEHDGPVVLPHQDHANRQPLADILLFSLFHRYLPALDRHITKQAATGTSLTLACGPDLYADLARLGFTRQERCHYIALFFQMRRAFFFIRNSLIGASPCMERLRARLWDTVFTHDIGRYEQHLIDRLEDFSTLLLGETGTGKGLAAAAIGRSGFIPYDAHRHCFATSFSQAFLAINLCQFPAELLESELFGHVRGAFTGAVRDHQGIFARSSRHGSVFLDEIGEISEQIQIKLLRILQERTFTPVGSHVSDHFEGRLIGATNRDLDTLRAEERLRDDFYFRISTVMLTLPPLRRRIRENSGELAELVRFLVGRIAGKQAQQTLAPPVIEELMSRGALTHDWPGNVRELEQAVRGIILTGTWQKTGHRAGPACLERLAGSPSPPTMAELASSYCQALLREHSTIQAVARITGLDRRTVKKHLDRTSR